MTAAQRVGAHLEPDDGNRSSADPWESAPAPAKVGRRILKGIFRRDVSAERIPLLTQVMHWSYGIGWGVGYALTREKVEAPPRAHGLLLGTGMWGASYAELVPMGIYEPPWRYPVRTLALDAAYHLVYGSAVAASYGAFVGNGRP